MDARFPPQTTHTSDISFRLPSSSEKSLRPSPSISNEAENELRQIFKEAIKAGSDLGAKTNSRINNLLNSTHLDLSIIKDVIHFIHQRTQLLQSVKRPVEIMNGSGIALNKAGRERLRQSEALYRQLDQWLIQHDHKSPTP